VAPQAPPPIRILTRAPKGPEPVPLVAPPVETPVVKEKTEKKKKRDRARAAARALAAEAGEPAAEPLLAGGSLQPRGGGGSSGAHRDDQGKLHCFLLHKCSLRTG
jgi:hypothetical protein